MIPFRITTYNIHKCRGLDRRVRPQRIVDVIRETNADIVALQEVVGMDEPERERNQVRFIAEELGFAYSIGENRRLHGGAYGNALLTRFGIVSEHNHDITWRMKEPRGCLQVSLTLKGEIDTPDLRIYNVHLGTGFFERRNQVRRLLDVVGEASDEASPRLLLGDINEWPRGLASHLLGQHFNIAEPRRWLGGPRSYPGVLPLAHVDHIYYDQPLKAKEVKLHRSRLALIASDHLPLIADFVYEGR